MISRLVTALRPGGARAVLGVAHLAVPLAVAAMAVIAVALPGTAAVRSDLLNPAAGARLDDAFVIRAYVDAADDEQIRTVEVRLVGPSTLTVNLQAAGSPDADGAGTWEARVDPLAPGEVLANGAYRMLARVIAVGAEPGRTFGHDIVMEVAPPQTQLVAAPSPEDATAVELRWDAVELPDFRSYRIQRRPHTGAVEWAVIAEFDEESTTELIDRVPAAGEYRYRVIVVRGGATSESEVVSASDPQGVRADPDDPGTFIAPPEPQPRPTATPTPAATAPTNPDEVTGTGELGPAENSTSGTPLPVDVTPQRPAQPIPVPQPAPAPAPAPVIPLDDGIFTSELPFEATETELTIRETETSLRDGSVREGGTLAVLTEDPQDRGVILGAATGLLLVVVAGHLRRFLAGGRRR